MTGLEYSWLPDGSLYVISEPVPAVRFIEAQSGHSIYQWTFHNSVIAAFIGWEDCRNDRKKAVRFGNDDPMDENILDAIAKFMEENKTSYKWEKGSLRYLRFHLNFFQSSVHFPYITRQSSRLALFLIKVISLL